MGQITLYRTVAVITLASLVVQPRALIVLPLLERGGLDNLVALMLGSALIPFVIGLVAPEARVVGIIALNSVALLGVGLLQWRTSRPGDGA